MRFLRWLRPLDLGAPLNNRVGIAAALNNGTAGAVGHGDGNDEADDAYAYQDVANQYLVKEGNDSGGERESQNSSDGNQGNGRTDSHSVLLMFVRRSQGLQPNLYHQDTYDLPLRPDIAAPH